MVDDERLVQIQICAIFVCLWYSLQEVSNVAMMQASALRASQHSKQIEVEGLRRQLLDYQVQFGLLYVFPSVFHPCFMEECSHLMLIQINSRTPLSLLFLSVTVR